MVTTRSTKRNQKQSQKFVDKARELDCDEIKVAFDEKLKRITPHKPMPKEKAPDQ